MLFKKELPFILSDCDGTIALPNFEIPETTIKDIVNYQKKSGYKFGIITGRNYIVNKKTISDLKVQLPVVSCNGALITDPKTNKTLHAQYTDMQASISIFRKAQEIGLDVICYTEDAIIGVSGSNRIQAWSDYRNKITNKKYLFDIIVYENLNKIADAIAAGTVKPIEIVIAAPDETSKTKMYDLFKQYEDKLDLIQSMFFMWTAVKKGTNKGSGLAKWAEIVNTDLKKVIVFGDNYNDVSMFKEVDKKYAVGNAVDDLKKLATNTIETVQESGVGKQLGRIIKENE